MSHAIPPVIVAIVASSCLLALAQAGGANAGPAGAGMGTGPGSAGGSAPSGMGTSAGNAGPSAPPGMGTKDTAPGDLGTNSEPANPNVQPATPAKSRAAAQAARNAGAGHAQNGLPIGAIGSGTSNEDQKATGSALSQNRFRPATQAQGSANAVGLSGRGSSLSDQVSRPRAARAGDKVLDAKARVERRTTVSPKRVTSPTGPGL
ncbi:hypothetical protein DCG74_24975 [Bradyrhizobium sp. WBAH42]|nr:hypothetical protein [Bradyrhizobium sp. WBAH30]MDD1543074.1 hypothetical protein [Bradyrhizobium sp. WBAH41]MDD1555004.1 hypothetical protein [Bradyrhizobium sp. WBAH23]MDD1562955.1 hypothetical protein [Bradyrhizobium sp. WBAH33]MDD1591056.1 hypothetical protein [Bradyrhizobium sp. WBAH42]NRB86014.1 hypothetical protein [Bradyrhizobium sp. WBAH10]QCJ91454.1 hypothetical protein DAA57_25415 [Bradyrhizobium yuanmingense]